MIQNDFRLITIAAAILGALSLGTATPALSDEVNMFDGQWHAAVTPYAWVPVVSGSTTFKGPIGSARSMDMSVDASNYLKDLEFAAEISGEARKGDWSVFTDYMYLSFKDKNSNVKTITGPMGDVSDPIDTGSTASMRGDVWTLIGAYTPWRSGRGHVDVFAGTRYLGLDTSLSWNVQNTLGHLPARSGSISKNRGEWDAIVGVKGEVALGSEGKWFMPYYVDIGSGSSNTTWQALIGAGYRYGWGELAFSVRSLSYKFTDKNENADVRFTGPALSARFAF